MSVLIYVEGDTETCLKAFFKKWLDRQVRPPVEIKVVNFAGVGNYLDEFYQRAKKDLGRGNTRGIIGLIDYYGSGLDYPHDSVRKNYVWAKQRLEARVGDARFRQHFAVHEIEAWLLSDLATFPRDVAEDLPKTQQPETINLHNTPCKRIKDLYSRKLEKKYRKPTEGAKLFAKLDPDLAYERCPHLKLLLDDLLILSRPAPELHT